MNSISKINPYLGAAYMRLTLPDVASFAYNYPNVLRTLLDFAG